MIDILFIIALFLAAVIVAWAIGRREGIRSLPVESSAQAELLGRVVGACPIVIWAADTKHVVRLSTGGALERIGIAEGQLVGLRIEEIAERDRGDADRIDDVVRTGQPVQARTRHIGQDGAVMWLRQEYVPIRGVDGSIEYVASVALDVTDEEERARANEREVLRRSALRLANL